jgi:hypothetical protein
MLDCFGQFSLGQQATDLLLDLPNSDDLFARFGNKCAKLHGAWGKCLAALLYF